MQYQVTRLDSRYSHRLDFEYMLSFSKKSWIGTGVLDFDRSRRWMNQTWGWSQDVDTRATLISRKNILSSAVQTDDINPHWAYSVEYQDYRIYLAGEQELNWFVLSHPNDA